MTGEAYLAECGWSRAGDGWEHPSEPGVVRSLVDALVAQGAKPRPARSWSERSYRGGARPAPDQWEGTFDNE